MKERLIGDDQLLVTADTTLGDALWDWVAADAARRAPDGWRVVTIGAVRTSTGGPAPGGYGYGAPAMTGVIHVDRLPPVSTVTRPVPEPAGAARPSDAALDDEPERRPPSDRTRVRRLPKRGRYDRATVDAILDAAVVAHVALGRRRPAVRDAHDRVAPRRPAVLARLVGQPDAPRDGRPPRLRDRYPPRRARPRALGLQPLGQLPVRDGPRDGAPRDRPGRGGGGAAGVHRAPLPGPLGVAPADDRRRNARRRR